MPRKSRWRGSSLSVVVAGSRGTTAGSFHRNCEHRVRPLGGEPGALPQQVGRVGVLEAVDGVAEDDVVARVEVRELVVVVAGLAPVGQDLVEVGRAHVAEDRPAGRRVLAGGGAAHLGHHRERRPGDAHVVGGLVVAAVRVHELGLLEEVVERPPGVRAQRGRAGLHRGVALDRGQREDGEGELPRGVVVVRGLGGVLQRGQRQHLLGSGHEVRGHLVLQGGVEARVAVEPVEGHRAVEVPHVGARALEPGGPVGPELVEGPAREGLVAGEKPRQREARQVLGGPLPRRPPRLERRQAGERVALGDEEAGVCDERACHPEEPVRVGRRGIRSSARSPRDPSCRSPSG